MATVIASFNQFQLVSITIATTVALACWPGCVIINNSLVIIISYFHGCVAGGDF